MITATGYAGFPAANAAKAAAVRTPVKDHELLAVRLSPRSYRGAMTTWINTVSREHVLRGVSGRFTQANHGKAGRPSPAAPRRLDRVLFTLAHRLSEGAALQAFTALGG